VQAGTFGGSVGLATMRGGCGNSVVGLPTRRSQMRYNNVLYVIQMNNVIHFGLNKIAQLVKVLILQNSQNLKMTITQKMKILSL